MEYKDPLAMELKDDLFLLLNPPKGECSGGCRKKKPSQCAGKGQCKDPRFRCAGHNAVACPGQCANSERKSWTWS